MLISRIKWLLWYINFKKLWQVFTGIDFYWNKIYNNGSLKRDTIVLNKCVINGNFKMNQHYLVAFMLEQNGDIS